jgi:uncharacterized protein (TIGR03435 family)
MCYKNNNAESRKVAPPASSEQRCWRRRQGQGLVIFILTTALTALPTAQPLTFDAASIKENRSGASGVNIAWQPGGRLIATNVTLEILIQIAFGGTVPLPRTQLAFAEGWIGGSDFLRAAHYDVIAVAPDHPDAEQMPIMLRGLLEERFNLKAHYETRNVPSYALVMARQDKPFGPRLRKAEAECVSPPPPQPTSPGDLTPTPCILRNVPGKAVGRAVTMGRLVSLLPNWIGDRRPVEDRTGLSGAFDLDLDWTPAQSPLGQAGPSDPDAPTLFTALQEQLGLKLETTHTDVQVVVVDRADKPTPD